MWNLAAHMYADRGACVSSCGEGRTNVEGTCQDCEGPCPRSTLLHTSLAFMLIFQDLAKPDKYQWAAEIASARKESKYFHIPVKFCLPADRLRGSRTIKFVRIHFLCEGQPSFNCTLHPATHASPYCFSACQLWFNSALIRDSFSHDNDDEDL